MSITNFNFKKARPLCVFFTLPVLLLFTSTHLLAQNTYPKMAGYVGILHPIITFDKGGTHANFGSSYTIGVPTGINIWKSAKVGFSVEMVPFVRTENNISRMNNFLFHPGVLVALGKGYTFAGRAAFETSGRFGFTPVLNKVIIHGKGINYFAAVPLPVRFGNERPTSITASFQFGIVF